MREMLEREKGTTFLTVLLHLVDGNAYVCIRAMILDWRWRGRELGHQRMISGWVGRVGKSDALEWHDGIFCQPLEAWE